MITMHVGNKFHFIDYLLWTKRELCFLCLITNAPVFIHFLYDWTPDFHFPYFVCATLGASITFIIAFKNNTAVSRFNEASKFYTTIQAISTNLGLQLQGCLEPKHKEIKNTIVKQHLAWLTALRYELRQEKAWENLNEAGNKEFMGKNYTIPEKGVSLEKALNSYLTITQVKTLLQRGSKSNCCLELQVNYAKKLLKEQKVNHDFFKYILSTIEKLNNMQVFALRLKNTPFPRSFDSVIHYFLCLFLLSLPFSVYSELPASTSHWVTGPISMLIGWVFICIEKIGRNTCNPFEGGVNDVPITAISRDIEIKLKTICELPDIPQEIKPRKGFLLL